MVCARHATQSAMHMARVSFIVMTMLCRVCVRVCPSHSRRMERHVDVRRRGSLRECGTCPGPLLDRVRFGYMLTHQAARTLLGQ